MKSIYFLGECMVELRVATSDTMAQSFAGDVYNSAVYLKRCFPDTFTAMITVIGQDQLSYNMLYCFETESLDTQMVFHHQTKAPGMYLVETDDSGERSFTYWRNDAAARKVVDFLDDEAMQKIAQHDCLFFSGISLAVIEPQARAAFWQKVETLKEAGVTIIFDPNYRARLWQNDAEAKAQFEHAFNYSDIVLPGVEDFEALYGIDNASGILNFLAPFEINEIIIKNGPESVVSLYQGNRQAHAIAPVTTVVDTTSAGDAFNGVYLGARFSEKSIEDSVQMAAKAAGIVIQHPGAITPKAIFLQELQQ